MEKLYKNRMSMFDFIKGLALALIVLMYSAKLYDLGEAEQVISVCWYGITYAGTTALMLATGYWFQPRPVISYTKEMCSFVLRIYLLTGVVCFFLVLLTGGLYYPEKEMHIKQSIGILLGFLLGRCNSGWIGSMPVSEIGGMWYVLAYFLGAILLNLLLNIRIFDRNKWLLHVLLAGCAIFGLYLDQYTELPFAIPQTLVATGTIYAGMYLKESGFLIRKWKFLDGLKLTLGLILYPIVYWIMGNISGLGISMSRTAMLFFIPYGILMLRWGLWVTERQSGVARVLMGIGRYSLWILVFYTIECVGFETVVLKEAPFMPQNQYLNFAVVLMLRVLFCIICIYAIGAGKRMFRLRKNKRN